MREGILKVKSGHIRWTSGDGLALCSSMNSAARGKLDHVFGDGSDSIDQVDSRAQSAFGKRCITWEGDPETFRFLYVSEAAGELLGYPPAAWLEDPGFWAEKVVYPKDRRDAIAYCALATGQGSDHDFVYRAVRADQSTVWLHDIVKVVLGPNKIPRKLRGLMFPVADANAVIPVFPRVTGRIDAAA